MGSLMDEMLKNIPKAVVHLRQQYKIGRLGLVFGAGISKNLDFPDWDKLVEGIASHAEIDGKSLYKNLKKRSNTTSITQLLFQHFKQRKLKDLENKYRSVAYREKRVLAEWREVVHEILYKSASFDRKNKIDDHPYLKKFIPLINETEFTVNYNFDDTLEFMLSQTEWNKPIRKGKAYQAIWNPYMQFRDDAAVIYHPNGYLPNDKNLQQSDDLVFSEESFSDQLIDSMSGKLSSLLHLFTKKTCFFVGLSLEDNTLKHLLRQASSISPGNYHYFIRYTRDEKSLTEDEKRAIFNSNFEVYNLITLFLNSEEVSELAELIALDVDEFKTKADIVGVDTKYNYYLVGTVGAGKSTILSHFGSLKLYEEWMEERPAALAKPFDKLSAEENVMVEKWTNEQFFKKNVALLNESEGIQLIDRTPLDPITFSKEDSEMQSRAQSMLSSIVPGESDYRIDLGQIILLLADPTELQSRLLSKRKLNWSKETLETLQKRTQDIYSGVSISEIENISRPINSVVKSIARTIFVDKYTPVDLHENLSNIARGID
jgi:hypothetical protein